MTVQEATHSKPSFEVWARLGETFSVIGRRPWVFFGCAIGIGVVVPYAAGFAIVFAIQTFGLYPSYQIYASETLLNILSAVFLLVVALTQLFLYCVLTLGAYDVCMNVRRSMRIYIGIAGRRMIPLALVAIPLGIIVGLAYVIIGILGLWATAVYSAILPIVVAERLGYRSMGRARALSKDYRWPIVGYLVILGIMLILLVVLIAVAIGAIGETAAIYVAPVLFVVLMAFSAIVTCVASAVIYARLRAIKEGDTVAELADVFA